MLNNLILSDGGGEFPPGSVLFGGWPEKKRDEKTDGRAQLQIVIVEDNPGDVFVMTEALCEHGINGTVTVIGDGDEAVNFFDRLDGDPSRPCPSVVLLDLNLPKRTGGAVLSRIRAGGRCAQVPVVIVSSSNAEEDVDSNKRLGATAYFRKPTSLDQFMQLGKLVGSLV